MKLMSRDRRLKEQDLASSVHARLWDDLHRVSTAYPVISSERPSGTKYPKVVKEYAWEPIHMSDLKEIKQAIVSYGLHLPFVREMVKTWASSTKLPHTIGLARVITLILRNRLTMTNAPCPYAAQQL